MKIEKCLEMAQQCTTMHQAAKLYNDIDMELSLGFYGEEEWDLGNKAQALLLEKFPGVNAKAHEVTNPPALSRGAGKALRGEVVEEEGHWTPGPPRRPASVRRHRPYGAALLVALGIALAMVLVFARLGNDGCPVNTSYTDTSLEGLCTAPSGRVVCVLWSFGYTPFRQDSHPAQAIVYSKTGSSGRWCRDAHNPPDGG